MQQAPKNISRSTGNRNTAVGPERRLNMYKAVLEDNPHFPSTLNYEDIDREVFKWVNDSLEMVYDGKKFSTYKLFSNQRMTEYGQTWQHLDDKGNLDINFKTVTRESNPQRGDIEGGYYNIPGGISFPIFNVRTIDDNGVEYTEMYSMKQPVSVNLMYTVGIFTNAYKMLNTMNTKVLKEFSALEKYIFPNGFAIPMELNSVSVESEYTIDDRKYYCQTYQIKVLAFIITNDDYAVTKVPSRAKVQFASGTNSRLRKKKEKFDIQQLVMDTKFLNKAEKNVCERNVAIVNNGSGTSIDDVMNRPIRKAEIEIEELCGHQICWEGTEDTLYVNRKVIINTYPSYCDDTVTFTSEYHMGLEGLQLKNIKKYSLAINGIEVVVEDSDVEILKGDAVTIKAVVSNEMEGAMITMICYDIDSIVENNIDNGPEVVNV